MFVVLAAVGMLGAILDALDIRNCDRFSGRYSGYRWLSGEHALTC